MSDKMLVERWDFDTMAQKDYEVNALKVREFITWLLTNNTWKDHSDFLMERCYKLRRELIEGMVEATDPLRKTNVKRDPETGRLVKRNG